MEYIRYIRQAATRSAELTKQLLAFARKQKAVPKVLDLNKEVVELLPMLRRLIDGRIQIDWRPGTLKALLSIDPSQLDQILTNLCVNAQDAISGQGKITIATGLAHGEKGKEAEEHLPDAPGYLVSLSVSDTGSGIDKQVVPHIFEPFFTTKEIGKGTGLGLSTVYGIVKQNKGSIECKTETGQGTTFTVFFPLEQKDREERSVSSADAFNNTAQNTIHTILLVDDEDAVLNLVQGILEKKGFRIIAASDAETAFEIVAESPFQIDLLLTDIRLPKMNGVELSRQLQAGYPDLKTLFMSGYAACANDRDLLIDSRCKFISKPFTIRDLLDSVYMSLGLAIQSGPGG
jgi:CheY-like chemotaxis protein